MNLKSFHVDKETGEYHFNQLLFQVRPYYLVPRNAALNAANPEQINMLANAVSAYVQMYMVDEGAFEASLLSCHRDDECLVEIYDDVHKRNLTGRPCHVDTIFGDGQEPFILPESLFLEKRQSLQFRCTDLSGQENNIRPVFGGQRIFSDRIRDPKVDEYLRNRVIRSRYMLPYMCPLDEDPLLTALQASQEFYFTQDAIGHFEVRKITFNSAGAFKFKLYDETGQELTSDWVHSGAGMGNANEPYIFYSPLAIRAGGMLKFILTDLSNDANQIYITLTGRMFYL